MKKILLKQFVKFCVVGTISMIIDVGVYVFLTRSMFFFAKYYLLANAIAFTIALVNSYTLNRKFTFQNNHKKVGVQFTKYAGVYIIGLGISEVFLYILVDRFEMYDLFAKAMVIVVVLFWNFIGSKFLIFDKDVPKQI